MLSGPASSLASQLLQVRDHMKNLDYTQTL
jgi:hypothetical protein